MRFILSYVFFLLISLVLFPYRNMFRVSSNICLLVMLLLVKKSFISHLILKQTLPSRVWKIFFF